MNGGVVMNVDVNYIQETLPILSTDRLNKVVVLVKELESEQKENRKTEVFGALDRLRGSLKDEGKSVKEYRAERLAKYEDIS